MVLIIPPHEYSIFAFSGLKREISRTKEFKIANTDDYRLSDGLKEWLEGRPHRIYSNTHHHHFGFEFYSSRTLLYIEFMNNDDALLFKLTWH